MEKSKTKIKLNKKTSLIFNVVNYAITLGLLLAVLLVGRQKFSASFGMLFIYLGGVIIAGIINALVHEFGHYLAGKRNGFSLYSFCFWFFSFTKDGGKFRFNFTFLGEESGKTEMIPNTLDNLSEKTIKMARGGLIASFIMMILGVIPIIISSYIPLVLYFLTSMFLPIGAYYFFGNALPILSLGARNDGATILGLKNGEDDAKVMLSILAISSELKNGKTPSEIEEKFYFEVPQLQEDNFYFISLLTFRYNYYLDKGDFKGAKTTIDRLISLLDYMPQSAKVVVKTMALYASSTFDFNEDLADDYMSDLEKYLNNLNNATNIRTKLAYIYYVVKEEDKQILTDFYQKGIREAQKDFIKGEGLFEIKLLEKIKNEF